MYESPSTPIVPTLAVESARISSCTSLSMRSSTSSGWRPPSAPKRTDSTLPTSLPASHTGAFACRPSTFSKWAISE
jgi:hypothetical protein